MKKKTYKVGDIVVFHFQWYGRTNPHDGHRCCVVATEVKRLGIAKRLYYGYTLEDLSLNLSPHAKRVFKMTDAQSVGTTLTKGRT